ncbi:MAG: TolC family protein [Planctomycetota bacterium]
MKQFIGLVISCVFLSGIYGCSSPGLEKAGDAKQPAPIGRADYPGSYSTEKLPLETEINSLSLDEAVDLAVKYNPELKAFRKDIDIASARIIQAKLLPNPEVFAETESDASKSFGFGRLNKSVLGLSQPIFLGGKINARTAVAVKEKDIAGLNYELKLRQLIAETKKTFVSILAAEQLVGIADDNLEVAKKLLDAVKTCVDNRVVPETELIKAEIQLSLAQANLTNYQTELFRAQKRLNVFFGNIDIKIKKHAGELKEIIPELAGGKIEEEAVASSPELVNAKKMRELAGAQYQLAQAERYPDITIGLGAGKEWGDFGNNKTTEWSINIPFPLFDRNQGRIKEARMLIAKSDNEYESALNRVRLEVKQAISSLENVTNQVKTYKGKILPQAEKSLSLISDGYKAGKVTYLEMLDAQRTLAETRQNYTRLLEELNNTAVDIEYLTGKPIDK